MSWAKKHSMAYSQASAAPNLLLLLGRINELRQDLNCPDILRRRSIRMKLDAQGYIRIFMLVYDRGVFQIGEI